jgi:GT2 family glycosyltransferase
VADKRLCIIILNWNSIEDTLRVLSILSGSSWDTCVVDNGSSNDQEANTIARQWSKTRVLETDRNLGYAGGMNVGMNWALTEGYTHALLLNPDTIPNANVIDAMLDLSDACAVVGTAQVTEDLVPYVSAASLNGRKPIPFECQTSCGLGHEVDIVSGAGILVDLNVAKLLDFMDERYFHYKEEFDFCFRVNAFGGKVRYNCGSPLIHRRGGSLPGTSPAAMYYSYRNELLFLRKHFGSLGWLSGLGVFRNGLLAMLRSPKSSFAILRGLLHGIRGVSGPVDNLSYPGSPA